MKSAVLAKSPKPRNSAPGSTTRRRLLKDAAGGSAALAIGLHAPAVIGQAKPFAGVTINGACFQHVFQTYLKEYLPEFEAATGMKVNLDLQAFPVYNQRMDLELSTKGSAYDFCNITFIYSGRWIGAGWMAPLDEYFKNPNKTPANWDASDFVAGAQSSLQDAKGSTYGFAWEAGAMLMGAARGDLIEKAGMKMPTNFDELVKVCDAVNKKDNSAAFVADKLHHWNFIPYMMGRGGKVFRGPPDDLTPLLDTPERSRRRSGTPTCSSVWPRLACCRIRMTRQCGPTRRPRQPQNPVNRLACANCQTRREYRAINRTLFADAVRAGRQLPGLQQSRLRKSAGCKEQGGRWEFIKWAMSKETLRKSR